MSTNPKNDSRFDEPENEAPQPQKPGKMRLVIALSAFTALVLFQMIVLAVVLRSFGSAPEGTVLDDPNQPLVPASDPPVTPPPLKNTKDMELDTWSIPTKLPESPDRVDTFKVTLAARIDKKNEAAYTTAYADNQLTIKAEIRKILEKSSVEDRKDPNLGTISRKVLTKVNEILGSNYVVEIVAPVCQMEPANY